MHTGTLRSTFIFHRNVTFYFYTSIEPPDKQFIIKPNKIFNKLNRKQFNILKISNKALFLVLVVIIFLTTKNKYVKPLNEVSSMTQFQGIDHLVQIEIQVVIVEKHLVSSKKKPNNLNKIHFCDKGGKAHVCVFILGEGKYPVICQKQISSNWVFIRPTSVFLRANVQIS